MSFENEDRKIFSVSIMDSLFHRGAFSFLTNRERIHRIRVKEHLHFLLSSPLHILIAPVEAMVNAAGDMDSSPIKKMAPVFKEKYLRKTTVVEVSLKYKG